jgi:hypothetical protein
MTKDRSPPAAANAPALASTSGPCWLSNAMRQYRLRQDRASLGADTIESLSLDDHRRGLTAAMAALLAGGESRCAPGQPVLTHPTPCRKRRVILGASSAHASEPPKRPAQTP